MNSTQPASSRRRGGALAATVVRIVAAYVLMGAVAKTLWGTPDDLPQLLQAMYWDVQSLLLLVIGAELIVAITALISTRLGWPMLVCALGVFLAVLAAQISAGEDTCGCFGSLATIPPWVMVVIDAAALLALLTTHPWSALASVRWRPWSIGVAALVACAGVLYVDEATREVAAPSPAAATTDASVNEPPSVDESAAQTDSAGANDAGSRYHWRLPSRIPRFVVLDPASWTGRALRHTELATWIDPAKIPDDSTVIIYYKTCGSCAQHLERIADRPDEGTTYVMIQVPTPRNSTHPVRVKRVPEGTHLKLPNVVRKWQIKTPWELHVVDGVVEEAIPPSQA